MSDVPELDLARINRYCAEKIPPQHLDKLRIEPTIRGKSVTIVEYRPPWEAEASDEWTRHGVAQLRYDPVSCDWSLFCSDRNSRWHLFEPHAHGSAEELIAEIEEDETGIFWG